jgi:hypothetical protein
MAPQGGGEVAVGANGGGGGPAKVRTRSACPSVTDAAH